MKFGSELASRSVPEWRAHNILYNDLKDEIKRVTSKQVPIADHRKLEDWFRDEFDNVSLFVKSKNGEIDYRISRCENLVDNIAGNAGSVSLVTPVASSIPKFSTPNFQGPYRDVESGSSREAQIYQLHREIARLTRDVQQLSRFINAQYTGFLKLIKKYRKWSGNSKLLVDLEQMLEGPFSFAKTDFTPRFLELSLLYDMVRSGKFTTVSKMREQFSGHSKSRTEELSRAEQLTRFDSTMMSSFSQSTKMWVHDSNLMELKVHLLKHMGLVSDASEELQYDTITYLDTKNYDYAQSRQDPGCIISVTLTPEDGPEETSPHVLCAPTGGIRHFTVYELSPQTEHQLLHGKMRHKDLEDLDANAKLAMGWYIGRDVSPTALVTTNRVRFIHQGNSDTPEHDPAKVWAAIDSNIIIKDATSLKELGTFPYSVLDLRWTGDVKPQYISDLEMSHLVFPVSSSFGIDTYALLVKEPEIFLGVPSWLSILNKNTDIRRLPKNSEVRPAKSTMKLRKRSSRSILLNDNRAPDLINDDGESMGNDTTFRYWNEFDHPDEEDGGDGFAVFIDDDFDALTRARRVEKVSQPIVQFSRRVRDSLGRVKTFFGLDTSSIDGSSPPSRSHSSRSSESRSLLSNEFGGSYSPRLRPHHHTDYESIPRDQQLSDHPEIRQYDVILLMLSSLSFCLAVFITAVIFVILLGDDAALLPVGIKIVIILGLTFSLSLCALGTCVYYLRPHRHWLGEVVVHAVMLTLICACVGGISLLASS